MRISTNAVLAVLTTALIYPISSSAATGFKTGERTSGMNKICYYDVLGSDYSITIGATQLCPLSVDAPNPAPRSRGFDPPATQGSTGFLTGERTSGMNKVCYYNVLGSTATLTVSSVSLCPQSHRF